MHPGAGGLLTDFYQLTMGQAYFQRDMRGSAVFELFVRKLPLSRRFLLATGLTQALEYLETLHFSPQEIEYLAGLGHFQPAFPDYLGKLRFTGSLQAMPEGTPLFADEPVLRVTAPIIEAQLVESRILNIVHFRTQAAPQAFARKGNVAGDEAGISSARLARHPDRRPDWSRRRGSPRRAPAGPGVGRRAPGRRQTVVGRKP